MKKVNRKKSERWAKLLWAEYKRKKNGEPVTTKDIQRLCGRSRSYVYRALKAAGIEGPPTVRSTDVLLDKQCQMLRDLAKELNRDWLYSWEMGTALGITSSNMTQCFKKFKRKEVDIPRIVFKNKFLNADVELPKELDRSYKSLYSSGLKVCSARKLPDGRIVYLLK